MARWPRPPMPMTPTREAGRAPGVRGGAQTGAPPRRRGAEGGGEASVTADAGGLRFGAEVLFAGAAPLADATGVCLPADADALAYDGAVDVGAYGRDGADDLVTGDERVAADAPVVVDEMDVGVADAAVKDADLGFVGPEFSGRVAEGEQPGSGGVGRESLDIRHGKHFSEDNPMT